MIHITDIKQEDDDIKNDDTYRQFYILCFHDMLLPLHLYVKHFSEFWAFGLALSNMPHQEGMIKIVIAFWKYNVELHIGVQHG